MGIPPISAIMRYSCGYWSPSYKPDARAKGLKRTFAGASGLCATRLEATNKPDAPAKRRSGRGPGRKLDPLDPVAPLLRPHRRPGRRRDRLDLPERKRLGDDRPPGRGAGSAAGALAASHSVTRSATGRPAWAARRWTSRASGSGSSMVLDTRSFARPVDRVSSKVVVPPAC